MAEWREPKLGEEALHIWLKEAGLVSSLSAITGKVYGERWQDWRQRWGGYASTDDWEPVDADYEYQLTRLDGWMTSHKEETMAHVRYVMDADGTGLVTKKQRSDAEIRFVEWVIANEQHFPEFAHMNRQILIEKYVNDEALKTVKNAFLSEGRGSPLPFEIASLGRSTSDARFAEMSLASFSNKVLKYLQGDTEDLAIFKDHSFANKKVWEVETYKGQWMSGEAKFHNGVPTQPNTLVETVTISKGNFGGAPQINHETYNRLKVALKSVWMGKYIGPVDKGAWGNYIAWLGKMYGSIGVEVDGWTYNSLNMSDFKFTPIKWADVLVDGEIDWEKYTGFGPDYLKYFMPQEVKSDAENSKVIDNSGNDTLTGFFEEDTYENSDPQWRTSISDIDDAHGSTRPIAALKQRAKFPTDGRLKKDFFKNFKAPFPKGLGTEGVTMNFGTMDPALERALGGNVQGISAKTTFHAQRPDGDVAEGVEFNDDFFRRFYLGYYFTTLYYYSIDDNKVGGGYSFDDIFKFCAFKTAGYLNQLWTQYQHDIQMANIYSVIVLLAITNKEKLKQIDPTAFMDAIESASDDAIEDVADEVPDDLQPIPNKKQREKFYKQCSLMLNMHKLAAENLAEVAIGGGIHQFHKKNDSFGSYNGRVHSVIAGGATALGEPTRQTNNFINRLMSPSWGQIKPFFDMENHEVAGLVPQIRLWKVYVEDGKLAETEFEFPTSPGALRGAQGVSGLFLSPFDRGDGIGLKEFSWVYDGETPATASKYIKGDLSLFFQTFTDFTALRTNKKGQQYRFVDLFASPSCLKKRRGDLEYPHNLHYDPEYYRIKVEVGWAIPDGASDELRAALWRGRQQFALVLVDHEININEDGTVNITANYRAYIEEVMDSAKFNALNSPQIQKERDKWKMEWDKAIGDVEGFPKCSDRDLRILRTRINDKLLRLTQKQHRNIMSTLIKYEKVFYVDFEPEHIETFRKSGIFKEIPKMRNNSRNVGESPSAKQTLEDWLQRQKKKDPKTFADPADIEKDYRAYYFFLGDLIYIVASNLFKDGVASTHTKNIQGAENSRVVLTDFQYYNPLVNGDQSVRVLNIADIPISVDFFFKWYTETIVRPDVPAMPIGAFIKKILIELVSEAMAEVCINQRGDFNTTFSVGSMTAGGIELDGNVVDPIQYMLFNQQGINLRLDVSKVFDPECSGECYDVLPLSPMPQTGGIENQFNYIIIYSAFRNPHHPGRGDRHEDHRNGCYHIDIGRPKGLVKKVSFSKNNIKYHRESRMLNQGAAGLSMLSAVYDCKVDMIGNTLFLPGMEFWLNPYGFGGEAFGMPQHRPFGYAPSPDEVDQRNQEIANMAGSKMPGTNQPGIDDAEFAILERKQREYERTGQWAENAAEEARIANLPDRPEPKTDEECGISSYANVMGIGGYQLVTKVECKISPGEYSTAVHAKHIFTGYAQEQDYKKLYEQSGGKKISSPNADTSPDGANCPKVINELDIAERTGND